MKLLYSILVFTLSTQVAGVTLLNITREGTLIDKWPSIYSASCTSSEPSESPSERIEINCEAYPL